MLEIIHLNFSSLSLVGSVGASFQCQSIHHDHICHDDSDKVRSMLIFTMVKMHAALICWIHLINADIGQGNLKCRGPCWFVCPILNCSRKLEDKTVSWTLGKPSIFLPISPSLSPCFLFSSTAWMDYLNTWTRAPKLITFSAICVCFQFEIS